MHNCTQPRHTDLPTLRTEPPLAFVRGLCWVATFCRKLHGLGRIGFRSSETVVLFSENYRNHGRIQLKFAKKNPVKIGRVVPEICSRTDTQTHRKLFTKQLPITIAESGKVTDGTMQSSTDPFELGWHVSGDTSFDGEGENETAGEVGEEIGEVLEQLAPERAAVDDVEARVGEVQAAHQRQVFRQKHPATSRHTHARVCTSL